LKAFIYLIGLAIAVVIICGIIIYLIESPHEDAEIKTLIDAIWWSSATVTTVGYGDVVPVTQEGRLMGIVLMFIGILVFGFIISRLGMMLIGSHLKERERLDSQEKRAIVEKIEEIEKLENHELELLINMLRDLHEVKSNFKKK
jgi:voltage-gated potassium channel